MLANVFTHAHIPGLFLQPPEHTGVFQAPSAIEDEPQVGLPTPVWSAEEEEAEVELVSKEQISRRW